MPIVLNRIIMHHIDKAQHTNHAEMNLRTAELNPEAPKSIHFVEKIADSYFKRSARQYSKFATGENDPAFKVLLDAYLGHNDFVPFSRQSTELLKDIMCDKPASTGGYVVMADFEIDHRFVMVVLVKEKGSVTVNSDALDIDEVNTLDIDQFAMAGFINLSIYQDAGNDRRYMSFMRGERDVSDYFTRFLGSAQDGIESAAAMTSRLVKVIQDYMHEQGYEQNQIDHVTHEIYQYGENQKRDRQPISLSAVANIVNHESPNEFFQYAQDRDVNAYLENIDMKSLGKLKDFQYKGIGYSVRFKKNLLSNDTITFDGERLSILVDQRFRDMWAAEGMGDL